MLYIVLVAGVCYIHCLLQECVIYSVCCRSVPYGSVRQERSSKHGRLGGRGWMEEAQYGREYRYVSYSVIVARCDSMIV